MVADEKAIEYSKSMHFQENNLILPATSNRYLGIPGKQLKCTLHFNQNIPLS